MIQQFTSFLNGELSTTIMFQLSGCPDILVETYKGSPKITSNLNVILVQYEDIFHAWISNEAGGLAEISRSGKATIYGKIICAHDERVIFMMPFGGQQTVGYRLHEQTDSVFRVFRSSDDGMTFKIFNNNGVEIQSCTFYSWALGDMSNSAIFWHMSGSVMNDIIEIVDNKGVHKKEMKCLTKTVHYSKTCVPLTPCSYYKVPNAVNEGVLFITWRVLSSNKIPKYIAKKIVSHIIHG